MGRRITYDGGARRVWTAVRSTTSASFPTHRFTSVPIGDAAPDRQVFVITSDAFASAVVPGGIAATKVVAATADALVLWRANVPTGTTASIDVTATGSSRILIEVYAVYGLASTTPVATANYTSGGTSTTHSTTIDHPAGGILIAGVGATVSPGESLSSWTGATLDDNTLITAGAVRLIISGASSENLAAATGATLQTTFSASVNAQMVAATYS